MTFLTSLELAIGMTGMVSMFVPVALMILLNVAITTLKRPNDILEKARQGDDGPMGDSGPMYCPQCGTRRPPRALATQPSNPVHQMWIQTTTESQTERREADNDH